jgi:hypothetical protein
MCRCRALFFLSPHLSAHTHTHTHTHTDVALHPALKKTAAQGVATEEMQSRPGEDRWERLERFARFKQRRLRLDLLPDDLLATVAEHLEVLDIECLLAALTGEVLCVSLPRDFDAAPAALRGAWIEKTAVRDFRKAVLAHLADPILFACAGTSMRAVVLDDWTPFASRPPVPLAEVRWSNTFHGTVDVDEERVLARVRAAVRHRTPVARLTAHALGLTCNTLRQPAILTTTLQLVPAHVLNAARVPL